MTSSDSSPGPVHGRQVAFDRVGGNRLTGLGVVVALVLVVGLASPPEAADRQTMVVVWSALVALLIVGVVWPLIVVRRIEVDAASPRDAVVGEHVPVTVTLSGSMAPCSVRILDPTGPWHPAARVGEGSIDHLADRRGVFAMVRVEVRVTAPVGLFAASRLHEIRLPAAVEVAPRPLAVDWRPASAAVEAESDPLAQVSAGGDLVRAVRPYAPGDPAHLVHWPSTAHTGALVVRELEAPAPTGQVIVLDLRDLGEETERAACYALGAARAVLAEGGRLILCTAEEDGPVVAPVRHPIEANRRLARAVVGAPGVPPEGWPVVEIGR